MTDGDIIKIAEYFADKFCKNCNARDSLLCDNCIGKVLHDLIGIDKRQQAEIERLKAEHDALIRNYKECAMDAVKDFAERIKEVAQDYGHGDAVLLTRYQIDSAVKEMEGKHGK